MLNDLMKGCWFIIQIVIGFNLILPLLLYIIHKIFHASKTAKKAESTEADYAIIVTAYQQTDNLPFVIDSILKLNYSNYLVYIVADDCDISNLQFHDPRIVLLKPEQVLAGNTRSHFYAIRNFKRNHERLTIIDSDNLIHPGYLNELNICFNEGFSAVQGIRKAKNLNTSYACLDAARDIYYHYYDGKMLFELGSSATLAGSGMAFTTSLYRDCLEQKKISGAGFDKVLQAEILKRNLRIAFAEKAIVFDEKTTQSDQLVNQRSRWINTWFRYFKYGFLLVLKGLKNFSRNQFLFGLVLLRPPLFIFLILAGIFMLINMLVNPVIAILWMIGFICFIIGFAIPVLQPETDKRVIRSLANIPKFMFYQVISLLNARKANKRSVATRHNFAGDIKNISVKS